jgi:hypothetical protein
MCNRGIDSYATAVDHSMCRMVATISASRRFTCATRPARTRSAAGRTGCETVTGAMKTPGHSRRAIAAIALTACCAVAGPTGKAAGQAGEQGG